MLARMTASRTCHACGANLGLDVMWCLRCYEPVRHLTPRRPDAPTVAVLRTRPEDEHEMSRWKAGVNTFGPLGRIGITVVVLALAPWSANLVALAVLWPAYLVLAILVLRATWKKDYVQTRTIAEMAMSGRPSTPADAPVRPKAAQSTIVAWALIAVVGLGVSVAWATAEGPGRGIFTICASVAALVLAVRWLVRD